MKNLKKLDLRHMTREELRKPKGGDGASSYTLSIGTTMPMSDTDNYVYGDDNKLSKYYRAYAATPVRAADTVYIYVRP